MRNESTHPRLSCVGPGGAPHSRPRPRLCKGSGHIASTGLRQRAAGPRPNVGRGSGQRASGTCPGPVETSRGSQRRLGQRLTQRGSEGELGLSCGTLRGRREGKGLRRLGAFWSVSGVFWDILGHLGPFCGVRGRFRGILRCLGAFGWVLGCFRGILRCLQAVWSVLWWFGVF